MPAALGLTLVAIPIKSATDFDSFYARAREERADAVLIPDVSQFLPHLSSIGAQATRSNLPSIGYARAFVNGGGLLYHGPTLQHHPRIASQIDKILKGAKPSDLPVEQPTKFDIVVNLKTAKALGLTVPQSLLLLAFEVIQ